MAPFLNSSAYSRLGLAPGSGTNRGMRPRYPLELAGPTFLKVKWLEVGTDYEDLYKVTLSSSYECLIGLLIERVCRTTSPSHSTDVRARGKSASISRQYKSPLRINKWLNDPIWSATNSWLDTEYTIQNVGNYFSGAHPYSNGPFIVIMNTILYAAEVVPQID